MLEITLQCRRMKFFFTLFLTLFFSALTCCFILPCYGSSDYDVENSISYIKPEVQGTGYSKFTTDISPTLLKIQDDVIRAGLLYDISSGTIIWEKNMHKAYPIASLTKMMVGLLVVEDINAGKTGWNSKVKVTNEATRTGGFTVSLKAGRLVSVEDLLKAAVISSGNDAAYLLAQFLGGTETIFVKRMNSRALQLGMNSTRFSNATGMPAANSAHDNRSSPSDILILCREMLKHDQLMRIAGMDEASIFHGNEIIKLKNHNRLVGAFDEVDGIKTGYTRNAKYCLATTASKAGRRVISIALGADSQDQRNRFVGSLLSQYYDSMGMGSLHPKHGYSKTYVKEPSKSNKQTGPAVYKIKTGDTLFRIANVHGCSVEQLKSWNRLKGNTIMVGQQLKIYRHSRYENLSAAQSRDSSVIYYKVQPGDTLWGISQKYNGVSVQKLMQLNGFKRVNDLKAGDTIKILLDIGSSPA